MTKGQKIEFKCVSKNCDGTVAFLVPQIKKNSILKCDRCGNEYKFDQELISKLEMFDHLVRAVNDAKPILGDTNVAIDFEGHNLKVPYRLLLTRLSTSLKLNIGGQTVDFSFRVEPLKDEDLKKWSS
ncbi:MAG: hypothetical protein JW728_03750 [Candidatus Aureabacteria bacterium]|nr:hypothetical protein [Candidatus Auribacterota bacterium]